MMSQLTPFGSFELAPFEPTSAVQKQHELVRLWSAVVARKWLFLGIVGLFTLFVGAVTYLTPKSYTTTVRLMAGNAGEESPNTPDTALPILNALMLQNGAQTAETFAEMVQQENIASAVIGNLGLKTDPATLLSHVTVKPIVNTAILDVSIKWSNATDSARIANEFATVFTDTERKFVQSQATAAIGFLEAELPHAEQRMNEAAARLAAFQTANGFIDPGTHTQQIVAQDSAVQERIEALSIDLQESQALYNNVHAEMGSMPSGSNPGLADLKTRLEQVEAQLAIARKEYTEQHPVIVALVQQQQALRSAIAAEPSRVRSGEAIINPNPAYETLQQQEASDKAKIQSDTANLAQLTNMHKSLAAVMSLLPKQGMELATLQQRAKLATDDYQALQQKYTDATIARTTALSDVSIIQSATADSAVITPSLARNLTVAPLIGLVLATLVVFILDYLERKFRDAGDVRSLIGLPVIATIPSFGSTNRRALPRLHSMTVEAFLHLCVSLRLSKKHPLHSLAITSPSIGDGKSTVAFNLAKALSNLQPPILLIDGDLRRSVLHGHASCSNEMGLSEILSGERTLDDCVQRVSPQLDLLTAGKNVPNPVALLQSERFDELLAEAAQRYSMTIIDTPALACVADGFQIASRVDGTALVIAVNTTDERVAKQVVTQFQALGIDNVVGVVLNKDRQRIHDYSDYFSGAFHEALPKVTP